MAEVSDIDIVVHLLKFKHLLIRHLGKCLFMQPKFAIFIILKFLADPLFKLLDLSVDILGGLGLKKTDDIVELRLLTLQLHLPMLLHPR